MGIETAILGSAALGAGSSLLGSSKAAKASQQGTEQSLALQREMFDRTQANLSPYKDAGREGLNAFAARATGTGGTYGNGTNPTWSDPGQFSYSPEQARSDYSYGLDQYKASPAYEWQLQQGLNAVQTGAAARGSLYSGDTMKAMNDYAANMALKDFQAERAFDYGNYVDGRNFARAGYDTDRAFNRQVYMDDRDYLTGRYDTQTANMQNLAAMGQSAAAGAGTAAQNYAGAAGNLFAQNAANKGNAAIAGANAMTGLLSNGMNAYVYNQTAGQGAGQGPASRWLASYAGGL